MEVTLWLVNINITERDYQILYATAYHPFSIKRCKWICEKQKKIWNKKASIFVSFEASYHNLSEAKHFEQKICGLKIMAVWMIALFRKNYSTKCTLLYQYSIIRHHWYFYQIKHNTAVNLLFWCIVLQTSRLYIIRFLTFCDQTFSP